MKQFEVRRRRGSYVTAVQEAPGFETFELARAWAEANWSSLGLQLGQETLDVVEVTRIASIAGPIGNE